ncbi:MAG TPA: hypothetical protein VFB72_19900, partial [Verrucomicrobiae bacterium]|nr:hypothetical protein [Verrucomicrobiae bacterium]
LERYLAIRGLSRAEIKSKIQSWQSYGIMGYSTQQDLFIGLRTWRRQTLDRMFHERALKAVDARWKNRKAKTANKHLNPAVKHPKSAK